MLDAEVVRLMLHHLRLMRDKYPAATDTRSVFNEACDKVDALGNYLSNLDL